MWADAETSRLGQTDILVLAPIHAAIFQALHMAIDHFGVPAIYFIDLARLLPVADDLRAAEATAKLWNCHRPLVTALALATTFLPRLAIQHSIPAPTMIAARVVDGYGSTGPLPRAEQLFRKLMHFDAVTDAIRYVAVQSRRNVGEQIERRVRKRSPRERLALETR